MAKAEIIQIDFSGGMNTRVESSKLEANEYTFLQNGRVRNKTVSPIKLPKLLTFTGIPVELKRQGIYALGPYVLVFAGGRAFYTRYEDDAVTFQEIYNFNMDPTVDVIYAKAVPASPSSYLRTLTTTQNSNKAISLASPVTGRPAIIICQDGVNQPRGIAADASVRSLNTYEEWSIDNQEYVPIGKQMAYSDGILYIVAPDGRTILRSLRGRPTDFVINIDNDGFKNGDAYTTAHSVGYNDITAIAPVQGNADIKLMVCSNSSTDIMTILSNDDFFGEPRYANIPIMATGATKQEAVFTSLGDMTVIDSIGIRSFNATKQLLTEANNDVFSGPVSDLFTYKSKPIIQDISAVGAYDNYVHYAVKTKYGYGILVYDLILKVFVSFDQYPGVNAIVQFAEVKLNGKYKLLFLTVDGDIYEAYGSTATATAQFVPKAVTTNTPRAQLLQPYFHAQFNNITTSGMIIATALIDRSAYNFSGYNVNPIVSTPATPYPLNNEEENDVYPVTFTGRNLKAGYSIGVRYSWNFDGELLSVETSATTTTDLVSGPQRGSISRV